MRWIAIATTVENVVIAAHDEIALLETVSELDFDVIVKIYGLSEVEYQTIKSGLYEYRVRFVNLRSVYLEKIERSDHVRKLSMIYSKRLQQLVVLRGRYEHALNKHRPILSQQFEIYRAKAFEASDMLSDPNSRYWSDGYVKDYAEEMKIDVASAATIVQTKYQNWHEYLRKLERLRLRHFSAIKKATTETDFIQIAHQIDKDFFLNILM